ncbi:MAG: S8 family serine peptidase, partial [Candidatus Latescibacterota bacterium]
MRLEFGGLDGNGVRVGVIDSGVETSHPRIGPLTEAVELRQASGGAPVWAPTDADRAGHGTACAGIIRRIAPRAELFSAAILDDSLSTPGAALV